MTTMEASSYSSKHNKEEEKEEEFELDDEFKDADEEADEFLDCGSADGNDTSVDDIVYDVSEEQQKVVAMRASLASNHPSLQLQGVDDFMIRRFLRARSLNIDKASALLVKYLNWRSSFVPNGHISLREISNELPNNMFNMQGFDKKGRPVVIVYGDRHKPSKAGPDEFKRYLVFCLDRICERMPQGQESFLCIADLEGWRYAHCDIRGYLAALSILQDCYPERLGKLLIIHVPRIFMAAWKIVYPFIDSVTKKKITFVANKVLTQTLLENIDESQVPEPYGGKLPVTPIQDA